jgi:hypothetical protein
VIQCRQCGANLPEQARFCLQCGTAVETAVEGAVETGAEQAESTPAGPPPPPPPLDFVQPALAGGMFLGVLSSLPLVSTGNILCCMWILGGGGIGSFLLMKQRPTGITYGDGAFVGVLSGVFGAVVGTLVSIPVRIIQQRLFDIRPEALEETLSKIPGLEGPMRDLMMQMISSEVTVQTVAFTFFGNLLMYSLFAMIGGILGVAILNKRK